MTVAITPAAPNVLVSFEYDPPTGIEWCIMHDNPVLAWLIDETGATAPQPVILGSMPAAAIDTSPVISPLYAVQQGSELMVPDTVRGNANAVFNFIATNNDAARKLYANFANSVLAAAFAQWSIANPGLALATPPNA